MVQKILWILLIIGLLPSCASMTDRQRTQAEGAAVGAGAGVTVCGLLGYLVGGEKGALTLGSLCGVAGAAAGYMAGTHIANKKEEYASREEFLDDVLKRTRAMNEELQQVNMRLAQDISRFQAETSQLVRQYREDQSRYRAVQAKHQEVEGELSRGRNILETVKKEVSFHKAILHFTREKLRSTQEQNQLAMMDPETRQLENHRDELEQRLIKLASIGAELRL